MRLSEDRINAIAYKVAFAVVKKRLVITQKNLSQVTAWVEKPILEDMRREVEIDAEVTEQLRKMSQAPPEGSFEYQALYEKKKEEMVRRRGYTI